MLIKEEINRKLKIIEDLREEVEDLDEESELLEDQLYEAKENLNAYYHHLLYEGVDTR